MKNLRVWILFLLFTTFQLAISQEQEQHEDTEDFDEFADFDISQFEDTGDAKAFCTNKVLGQSPTALVSLGFDIQGPANLQTPAIGSFEQETAEWQLASGFRFNSNIPVVSKNSILINWGFNFTHLQYQSDNDVIYQNPLNNVLSNWQLNWLNTNVTVFKPLNDRHFLLAQATFELNGDYSFGNGPSLQDARIPLALIFGFKPHDRLMWGPGISRTYLGGALNVIPVIYYYHTFKNENWGIEAIFPRRIQARYRTNSRNVWLFGYNVEGATYRLSNFANSPGASTITSEPVELRRSEIRAGFSYSRGLNDFIWLGMQAGYRINYSFELDEDDFFRGFDSEGYLQENTLDNTWYFQFSISLVSP